ncbi:uroporphyrinogen decarboxylase family protein [Haloimpatiens massiliensis]|uniref:uroporphyrinogen decarboxylase family protein n=1 Tax=Haloimpatiens massiliensis TaxID=1658110 RepID=UPI000C842B90|nr:uroporphyrinogen decarboxylase family protein [Haloimpatiens massiliensis]
MHVREDIMISKDRVMAFLQGKPVDRIPCMPIVTANASHLIGKTINEFQLDPQVMADSYIAAYERFKYDLSYLFTNTSFVAEAMGQELAYYEDEPACTLDHVIKSREDLSKIKIADKNDGKFPVFYQALDILNEKLGDKIVSAVCFSGPLSTAATLRGTENFVKDMYNDPEFCIELLKMTTETCKNFMKEVIAHGAVPIILEPISSGSLLSPRMYKKFSLPYTKELIDLAHSLNTIIPLHICGKTHKIIDLMADTGADILSIDICDLNIAREKVAGRAVILGNITPANELLFGTREEILEICKKTIEQMEGYEGGFILASGCEIPKKVPFENIDALVDSVRIYGTYDYQK